MGLKVKIDNLGIPQRDFEQVKSELMVYSGKFDDTTLAQLPYHQLVLAALGTAGDAMCDLKLVQAEKQRRRARFLSMPQEEFETMRNFLIIEQMHEEVCIERAYRAFPRWADLNERQKIWLKLTCIFNHVDEPNYRINEVLSTLRVAALDSQIPADVAFSLSGKLKDLCRLYPLRIEDHTFRDRINVLADAVFQFIPEDERPAIENEQVQGYGCTSDCYRTILS